jgi:hypothetical protein
MGAGEHGHSSPVTRRGCSALVPVALLVLCGTRRAVNTRMGHVTCAAAACCCCYSRCATLLVRAGEAVWQLAMPTS